MQATKNHRSVKGMAAEDAYRRLREEIVRRLRPGDDLNEELLASLGLSRTPAREAFQRLAADGLVELSPNRGARVAPLGWVEVREHLESLEVVQRLVSRLAAARRTEDQLRQIEKTQAAFESAVAQHDGVALTEANLTFHIAISEAARNSVFTGWYRKVLTQGLRIDRHAMFEDSFPSGQNYQEHLATIASEHEALVSAIRDRDMQRADDIARQHAILARRRITQALSHGLAPVESFAFPDL